MSTIPFVQVEGAIALPRVLPLDRIPPPFGGEWRLLPPHFSLRIEMKALYAAIMRTVCLSAEAFRAACRWDLHRRTIPEPAGAPIGDSAHAGANGAVAMAAPFSGASLDPAAQPHAEASRQVPSAGKSRMSPADRSRLAGGACAIGGAALLTWILASHAPHNYTQSATPSPIRADHESGGTVSQRLADERTAHELAVADSQKTLQTSQVVALTALSQNATPAPGTETPIVSQPKYSAESHHVTAQPAILALPLGADDEKRPARPAAGIAKSTAAIEPRAVNERHAARTFAPHRVSPHPVTTHRTAGKYSKAGHYSPRRPSAHHSDEYASIVSYASTYTAPRPASRLSVPVDSTEWVNHVSQRRVTEIPDSFAK
ncbi:hypothetical protein [Paraburkholderia acidipaludis]|uniref:hypothetical protein n=1 Tax=Paraburkholderia acidipaludis TaxID=660537 RepID=UPI000485F386|nr:hypothetical protein [Paraburkholderia acidipaludis]